MIKPYMLKPDIFWIGARHPELKIFDELLPTRKGSTYNAYLVRGQSKTALIDTVKGMFTDDYLETLREFAANGGIDLLVVNHTEPDHSGAIARVLEQFPDLPVYCTKAAENFLRQLLNGPFNAQVVNDGDELDLGGRTLRFIAAPSLHWPETMVTYLVEDQVLFSCDAFGAHYCGKSLFHDEEEALDEFEFYYQGIMRPFKEKIREALDKIEPLALDMICPSHGPIWRKDVRKALESYREWSAPPPGAANSRVLLLVHSAHGNTRAMAKLIRQELESRGLLVVEKSIVETSDAEMRDEMEASDALVVGIPTINRDAAPPVWHALALLSTITPRGRIAAVFGAFGWSGEAVRIVEERLKGLKYSLAAPGVNWRFSPTEDDRERCREMAEAVAHAILERG